MLERLSLSLRFTAWYGLISAVGFTIFGVVMWFVLASTMLSWKDRTLQMRAARMQSVLSSSGAQPRSAIGQQLENMAGLLPEGEWISVVGIDGKPLFPADRAPFVRRPQLPCSHSAFRDPVVAHVRLRELCEPVFFAGQPAALLVPSPLTEDRILLGSFTSGLYRLVPMLLLVSGLGGYLLSRRALAPVDVVIHEARRITANDLSRRLSVPAAHDQLRALATEWNNLLSRIEDAMISITQFTADASHELRSPVAFIRATAEYQLGQPTLDREAHASWQAVFDETSMMTDLLESLLLLARPRTDTDVRYEPVNGAFLLEEILLQLKPAIQQKGHQLSLHHRQPSVPVLLPVSAGHLRSILTIVVDNAIKYTPAHGEINIEYGARPPQFRIADNGIGIAVEHLRRVFDRFFRVDQARTDMREGVGSASASLKD